MQKVAQSRWQGAIFAAAGLERIGLRPANAIDLHWMLPAPAQGAIVVVCRSEDEEAKSHCLLLNDELTAICTKTERSFLSTLMGGCSTPIGALATVNDNYLMFKGNMLTADGKEMSEIEKSIPLDAVNDMTGSELAREMLRNGGEAIAQKIRHATR